MSRWSAPLALFLLLAAAPLAAQPCACDCDADSAVRVNELTLGVNIALARLPLSRCFAADLDGDARVVVAELISAVRAALNGCPSSQARLALAAARQRFAALEARSYDYNYRRFCFCFDPPDVDIEVRNDEIVSIRDVTSGLEVTPQDPNAYLSIPQLFDFIDNALGFADVIDVEYDAVTGVPLSISVDFQKEAVDDELGIRISDFHSVAAEECRSDADCNGPAAQCVEPGGFVGCGICQDLEGECAVDSDCGGDLICDFSTPSACSCQGPVLVCQSGCAGDGDCDEGETCDTGRHCRATPCATGDDCPAQFRCVEGDAVCQRRSCGGDGDCASTGRCVNAFCYDDFGTCQATPPRNSARLRRLR
jgi:hypothetical protein